MTVPHWNALTDIQSVGLDVCKSSIRVCILTKGQTLDYEIKNDSQEIKKFCKSCCIPQMKNVPFIIESTGDYHIGMTLELKKCDMNVKEINPIITKQYTRSSIRGTKTDKTDAVVLAKIGVIEGEKLKNFNRTEEEIVLKKKIALIANLETKIQGMKRAIDAYYEGLKKLGIENIDNEDVAVVALEASEKMLKKYQKEIENHSFQNQEDNENVERLMSIVGVSKYMAIVFYVGFANKQFVSKEAMYAFVGCEPKLKQSGTVMIGTRMSKRGNSYIRKKLYQCAFCSQQHCEKFKKIYDRMKEKGKHHGIACNVIIKKLVHIMWSLLQHKTMFDPSLV